MTRLNRTVSRTPDGSRFSTAIDPSNREDPVRDTRAETQVVVPRNGFADGEDVKAETVLGRFGRSRMLDDGGTERHVRSELCGRQQSNGKKGRARSRARAGARR